MKISEYVLKIANTLVNLVVIVSLLTAGLYAIYALWDNSQIYAAVDDAQADMLKLKPDEDNPSFEELLAINPDVRAWVTLDNTKIDQPVLQGETNLTYINTDVYGDFSLAGSIYLDSRNDGNFRDAYSLLYGHHIENGGMFGDLVLYEDEEFFKENQTGTLILPDRVYKLKIFACLRVSSSEERIFNPGTWHGETDGLMQYVDSNALYVNDTVFDNVTELNEDNQQILALSTCSSEITAETTVVLSDERTVVLALMEPYVHED